ncbi:F-box/FBD/LRR-repeat protein At1g13570-like [Lolium rigidum]|uniref:F-box/FBD/LRR-repeat protein At1g13570-like n=1 Tax=Lolium rigidum TaxID=89674 RepID=UPI001F5CE722|nr:F-box/FBD/LRR-repeat protein At1g13570-like [Lolium rigidum]
MTDTTTSVIPAAAAAGEDPDLISLLPDCLLTSILSLLPIDAAARTTALSSRWRRLWPSTPLHLIDSHLRRPSADAISDILASHRCNAVRFQLLLTRPSAADLDSWLRALALKHLQQLVLAPPSEPLRLPPSFHACRSLTAADLTNCRLPAAAAPAASFPHLANLTLRHAYASPLALHGLLAACPALVSLSLDRVFGCRTLRVRSRSLRSLTEPPVSLARRLLEPHELELEDLVVEDAPALERLLAHDVNWGPSLHVVHAPRLETLGYLGVGIPSLQLGSALFHAMRAVRLPAPAEFRTVKTLALEMVDPQVKPVVDFLQCFPCLETLHITSHMVMPRSMETMNSDKTGHMTECLHHHLKKVVLVGYKGRKRELQLAIFLISNARVLEVMKFLCENDCNPTWLTSQRRRLRLENRASLGAQVIFEKHRNIHVRFSKHASNISVVDPFDIQT